MEMNKFDEYIEKFQMNEYKEVLNDLVSLNDELLELNRKCVIICVKIHDLMERI